MNDKGRELLEAFFNIYGDMDEFKAYVEAQGYSPEDLGL